MLHQAVLTLKSNRVRAESTDEELTPLQKMEEPKTMIADPPVHRRSHHSSNSADKISPFKCAWMTKELAPLVRSQKLLGHAISRIKQADCVKEA